MSPVTCLPSLRGFLPRTGLLLEARGTSIDLSRPRIMGILNITPDSFFDGGKLLAPGTDRPNVAVAVRKAKALVSEGADLLDVGGESTRPGAEPVPVERECARVVPVVEALAAEVPVPISIDTRHAETARRALEAGAALVNDISCLADGAMAGVCADAGAGLVVSHLRGEPRTMQENIAFERLIEEVATELAGAVERARAAGVSSASIVVDPGIGFGKTAEQSAALLVAAGDLEAACGCPVLVGASRKRFLGAMTGRDVGERLVPSVTAAVLAVGAGARIVRVHDVAETRAALTVAEKAAAAYVRHAPSTVDGGSP